MLAGEDLTVDEAAPTVDPSGPDPSGPAEGGWRGRPRTTRLLIVAAVLALVAGTLLLTPLLDRRLTVGTSAVDGYDDAMAAAASLLARDDATIAGRCRSQVLEPGAATDRAVVLLHGYTNCPAQFEVVAAAYAATGAAVVVPRLPGHGEADRLSRSLSTVTSPQLVETVTTAVDIAAGLGDEVTVVGLSGGGALTGWLAAHHDAVDEAVLLAPLVAPRVLPTSTVAPVARLSRVTPDLYLWWDSERKAELAEPPYAYPRYSVRSLGAFLAVGRAAQQPHPGRTTELQRLVVVSNPGDLAVSAAGVDAIADHLGALVAPDGTIVRYRVPAEAGVGHDLIDPEGENAAAIAEIYAELEPLLGIDTLVASLPDPGPEG